MRSRTIIIRILICLSAILLLVYSNDLQAAIITSPDGRIAVTVQIQKKSKAHPTGDRLYYSVKLDGKPILLASPFQLDFKGMPSIAKGLSIVDESTKKIKETWTPVWGTQSQYINHCNELFLKLKESDAPGRSITFTVRVFDDGVAFQYGIPEQSGISDFKITQEFSEFHFAGNPTAWIGNYPSFREHQETEYNKKMLQDAKPGEIIGCPLLLETDNVWVALTEANLVDWAGIYYTRHSSVPNAVVSLLSPRLDEQDVAVISKAPRVSPWRVIMIGDKPGDLIENNMIVNLADPSEIEDPSWITPGISAWDIWWCGNYAPDFEGDFKMDNASMKYFIDFAAEMGWEYQLVDWTWYGAPFDPDQPLGAAGNTAVSTLEQAKDVNIPELVTYAEERGVKILIWLDWFHADQEMEQAFPLYEQWGVAGVKVDFMARYDQYVVNFYHRLVKLAAKHHLTVDFHGAYKPTGFRRTYPNLLTREGVLGNEYNKWSDRITPRHNVTLPFTRMLCGPMDYTPGGFRNKTLETFRVVGGGDPGPFVMTTRSQQLAMMVVYESPLQVCCDSPYNYRMSPAGTDFLKLVPTTWDDTKVLDGYPGEYILIARKSGKSWFVGGMTNESIRTVKVPLSFLGKGTFNATIWSDPEETADYPDRIWKSNRIVTADDVLTLDMAAGGGFVIHIDK
ncbi:glycoside hydrolase family 97 protein [candidate division KSB1 bacterium]|nr:glycoside hydrolase family 97 protein [candidate division KSB1 bacterium]